MRQLGRHGPAMTTDGPRYGRVRVTLALHANQGLDVSGVVPCATA